MKEFFRRTMDKINALSDIGKFSVSAVLVTVTLMLAAAVTCLLGDKIDDHLPMVFGLFAMVMAFCLGIFLLDRIMAARRAKKAQEQSAKEDNGEEV